MIPFSEGILLAEESADRQTQFAGTEKEIQSGWLERQFQRPLADLPDKGDCACNEKAHRLPALRNVERYRAQLRFSNTPLPMFAIQPQEKRAAHR
jgi:hypothetical protein